MNRPRLPTQILGYSGLRDSPLHDLLAHARRLEQIQRLLLRLLETPLAQHCRIADLRQGRLLLHADASAWATKMRFQAPSLLERLRRALPGEPILSIQVQVRLPDAPARTGRRAATPMSAANAEALRDMAAGIVDPGLKAALMRLARRGRGAA